MSHEQKAACASHIPAGMAQQYCINSYVAVSRHCLIRVRLLHFLHVVLLVCRMTFRHLCAASQRNLSKAQS